MDLQPRDDMAAGALDAILRAGKPQAAAMPGMAADVAGMPPPEAIENYADLLDELTGRAIVNQVADEVELCEQGRRDLIQLQRDGIKRLGVDRTIKARSEPFEGASVVVHPSLMQA